jgi:flagellar biosynthesis/type III secretory pathway protein FliH
MDLLHDEFMKAVKEDIIAYEFEKAKKEGFQEGFQEGEEKVLLDVIATGLKKGTPSEEIMDFLCISEDEYLKLVEKLTKIENADNNKKTED